jgi:outer membrane protein TolC
MNRTRKIRFVLMQAICLIFPIMLAAQNTQDQESLNLKQAVEKALQNSREVTQAQIQYDVSRRAIDVNRAVFKPNLYTGSGIAYTHGFPQTVSGAAPSIINLSYVQTVFNPLMTAEVKAAMERSEAQRLDLEKTRNLVMFQTSSTYLELTKIRYSLERMQSEQQSNSRILDFTRQRLSEGLELPIEVTRAELAEARTHQQIVRLETRGHVLERQLSALLGIPSEKKIEVEPASLKFDEAQQERDLAARAVENSLDVKQAEAEQRARSRRLEGEIGSKWPTVDVVGEYGLFAKFNNFQQFFNNFERNNLNIGLQVKIPLYASQRTANIALARSELNAAENAVKVKRQTVELDVSSKYQRLREVNASREVARLELKLAQENLQQLQAGFEEGKVNLRDMERARIDENEKWVTFLDIDYERQKAQLDLMHTTGNINQLLQ